MSFESSGIFVLDRTNSTPPLMESRLNPTEPRVSCEFTSIFDVLVSIESDPFPIFTEASPRRSYITVATTGSPPAR